MNLKEAYSTLNLDSNATEEEVKKRYKELTRKYHPDVNKEPDADAKFKKINEAYARIKEGDEPEQESLFSGFEGFNPFGTRNRIVPQHISLQTSISFQESVLGVKKNIVFDRKSKCNDCDGQGKVKLHNGCEKCKGRGQVTTSRGQMIFVQTCDKCAGKIKVEGCKTCSGEGSLDSHCNINVSIPGGVSDGNILRLAGMGNYIGNFMGLEQSSDVHLHIEVQNNTQLFLEGADVVSTLKISLLEALQGCTKIVPTVLEDKKIEINAKSKNKDVVLIPKHGVNKKGNQKVILEVEYPDDIESIINALQQKEV